MSDPVPPLTSPPPGVSGLLHSFTRTFFVSSTLPSGSRTQSLTQTLDFDAGINASTAWTERRERGSVLSHSSAPPSLSDDEDSDEEHGQIDIDRKAARVLHKFEGKLEFRELSVEAGDEIEVLREEAGHGWSLVRNVAGEVGLLPQTYYTFTQDFLSAPLTASRASRKREAFRQSITPRASPNTSYADLPDPGPIVVQTTGERMMAAFPSFRKSLLGGKALNRFSSFVTSGAEAYVLRGPPSHTVAPQSLVVHDRDLSNETDLDDDEDKNEISDGALAPRRKPDEADRHFVDAGPCWRSKVPPFRVFVHSPSKRSSTLSGSFTIYSVTSLFYPSLNSDHESSEADRDAKATRITVHRRFSHFVVLHTALTRRLPGIALPPLPEKQYTGRFNDDFVEARRGDLERYLAKVVKHPVARYAEIITFFLGCESDLEWKRQLPRHLSLPPAGPSFYANVFHPEFNFDAEEARETADRFEAHTGEVSKSVQTLRNTFALARQSRVEMSKAERLLSYSLLSLVTGKPLASAQEGEYERSEEEYSNPSEAASQAAKKVKGVINEEGAWCWRERCDQCLKLTKALVKTGETLQSVADLYDDHARRTQLRTHNMLKTVAHPSPIYAPILDTHRNALSRYAEASQQEQQAGVDVAARCETVLNTTIAEMETYHAQKVEDFSAFAKDHLDNEIEFYEQALARLQIARSTFDPPAFDHLSVGARQPSIYERELENPRLDPEPLPQPCPHVYDSTPMRPVSHAIQKGIGLFLSGSAGRASVFGQFW